MPCCGTARCRALTQRANSLKDSPGMQNLGVARRRAHKSAARCFTMRLAQFGVRSSLLGFGPFLHSTRPLQACPARVTPESSGSKDLSSRQTFFLQAPGNSYFLLLPPSLCGCGWTHCRVLSEASKGLRSNSCIWDGFIVHKIPRMVLQSLQNSYKLD